MKDKLNLAFGDDVDVDDDNIINARNMRPKMLRYREISFLSSCF